METEASFGTYQDVGHEIMFTKGGEGHLGIYLEDNPIVVGLPIRWFPSTGVDRERFQEVRSGVLTELCDWAIVHVKHDVRDGGFDTDSCVKEL